MNDLNINAVAHRIIIKDIMDEDVRIGSIIIPQSSSKKKLEGFEEGIIVDIGETAFDFLDKKPCRIGDKVIMKKYSGVAITRNGGYSEKGKQQDYRIINDEDIIAVYSKEN